MAARSDIVQKAYKCLDEIYPDSQLPNEIEEFRVNDFVDDAIRFIGRIAPVRALGKGVKFGVEDDTTATVNEGGQTEPTEPTNSVALPSGFVRLIAFQMSDWALPVTEALYSDNPRYRQQADPILMGTPKRPIVFICDGDTNLEYYSSTGTITKAQAFVVSDTVDYPAQLSETIAWKTAEMVLSVMNDAQAVQFAQAQLKQLFEAL